MKDKNKTSRLLIISLFALLLFVLVLILIIMPSCSYYMPKEKGLGEEVIGANNTSITRNDTEEKAMVVTRVNITGNKSAEQLGEQEEVKHEEQLEEQTLIRASEVEFYFLLKKKSYFRDILEEEQRKTYNISGYPVSIEPIIITQDSVKLRINNYTTKALQEDDSDSTQEFEIIIKDIYYRR